MISMRKAWTVLVVTFLASVAMTVNRFKVPPVMGVLTGPPALGSILNGERWTLGSICLGGVMGLGTIASVLAGQRMRSA